MIVCFLDEVSIAGLPWGRLVTAVQYKLSTNGPNMWVAQRSASIGWLQSPWPAVVAKENNNCF
jgi:hypothetical protein